MAGMKFLGEDFLPPNEEQSGIIREMIRQSLPLLKDELDLLLKGEGLSVHKEFILYMTDEAEPPHWYPNLLQGERPEKTETKAIGTMMEYLFACVLKKSIIDELFDDVMVLPNPSRGIDLPELNIDIKAPGKKLEKGPGTSTRAHSPFERLFGLDYHCVILHTNLKTEDEKFDIDGNVDPEGGKKVPLRIMRAVFLEPHELGDTDLSNICGSVRETLAPAGRFTAKKHVVVFKDLCKFLTFSRRDDKTCNGILRELREIAAANIEDPEDLVGMLNGPMAGARKWLQMEDGRNFSLRDPSVREMRRLVLGPLGGRVTVSFKNELFLQFRQLLDLHDLNTST